jgi:hypothetical protein
MANGKIYITLFAIAAVTAVQGATESFNFKWKASLNSDTGIATSREESLFVFPTAASTTQRDVANFARSIIHDYPKFLTRPSLTLGLITRKDASKETALCTSVCHLNLLSFGSAVDAPKPTYRKQARKYSGNVVCCVEIPILGGLLSQSSAGERSNAGCLRFTLIRNTKASPDDAYKFVTEIAGNYQPSIAGERYPRSKFRSAVYCATQRMFHEYVMWRFHRAVRDELKGNI